MYKIGDTVMYPGTGVCRICDIVKQKFMRTEERTYYVLKAIYDNADTTIYCPVDNTGIKVRKLLSREDIGEMIHSVSCAEKLWIDNDNERKKAFSQILKDGDQSKILRLIVEIHEKKEEKEACGKKLHLSDEKIMHEAEKLIQQELAYSMDIKVEEVAAFVMKELESAAK